MLIDLFSSEWANKDWLISGKLLINWGNSPKIVSILISTLHSKIKVSSSKVSRVIKIPNNQVISGIKGSQSDDCLSVYLFLVLNVSKVSDSFSLVPFGPFLSFLCFHPPVKSIVKKVLFLGSLRSDLAKSRSPADDDGERVCPHSGTKRPRLKNPWLFFESRKSFSYSFSFCKLRKFFCRINWVDKILS